VDSYDEETYLCKPNDTFEKISTLYYHTDNYERALLLFNRNHPRAPDGVRQEPPLLQEGQPVFIPPLRILEKQYGNAIKTPPTPLPPAGAPKPPPGSATSNAAPSGDHTYRVRKGNEMVRDVARRTLGNADRWEEIYRLNPQFNPSYPLPESTVLRLPADARVDPEDTP
jgi:nucleoid-associated protein YgaU